MKVLFHFLGRFALALLCLGGLGSTPAFAYRTIVPDTTVQEQTANNTPASTMFTDRYKWNLVGRHDGPITLNGDDLASNVSHLSVHDMLYAGATTKVYAHYMGWFKHCSGNENGGTLVDDARCGSHVDIGYNSYDSNGSKVTAQLQDMQARGIDGAIIDWYGPGTQSDNLVPFMRSFAEHSNGTFRFGINIDNGSLNCSGESREQCVTDRINYVYNHYMSSSAWMKSSDGHPMVDFFLDYTSVDWSQVKPNIPSTIDLIFENANATNPNQESYSNGGYSWLGTTRVYVCDGDDGSGYPHNWPGAYPSCSSDPYWFGSLNNFYNTAIQHQNEGGGMHDMGSAYKGFDDAPVNGWGSCGKNDCRRVIGQQCGLTWTGTFDRLNAHYSSNHQLEGLQLVTWDDYEEGTEIESGIDNCLSSLNAAIDSSGVMSWAPAFGSDQYGVHGNESTVDHYVVYVSLDGENLMDVQHIAAGTHTFDLNTLDLAPGSYYFYLQAVGKSSILNHLSPQMGFTIGLERYETIYAPANNANVAQQFHVSAQGTSSYLITASAVYLDSTRVYTSNNGTVETDVTSATGNHKVTVQFWDSQGVVKNQVWVNVYVGPTAVLAVFPNSGRVPLTVFVSLAGSTDPDGAIVSYLIDCGNGMRLITETGSCTYTAPGTYTVTGTVTDFHGLRSQATQSVRVVSTGPR